MTCILATSNFMIADRRVVEAGNTFQMCKLSKNKHMIVGVCGYAATSILVTKAIKNNVSDPNDLIKIVFDGLSQALILTSEGELFKILDGALFDINNTFVTIGSGYPFMLGYIHGSKKKTISQKFAKEAMKFVCKQRTDCGDGHNIKSFKK